MQGIDVLGYAASAFVILTFYMKDMVPLRAAALCSNVCFLAYGVSLKLGPVVVLPAALIPINLWRLSQALAIKQPYQWLSHQRLQLLPKRVARGR
jgi:CRP/FNR family cyclic AMP-dependent transcriptional regulator